MIQIIKTWMVGDLVHFELSAPSDIFRPLAASLVQLGELSHALDHKKRIACAGIKQTPEQLKFIEQHREKFKKFVLKEYSKAIQAGSTHAQAISAANRIVRDHGSFNCSHDLVRQIVGKGSK